MPSGIWAPGRWAWIPEFLIPKNELDSSNSLASQVNINHLYGRTDSYTPSRYDSFRRQGVVPPPRGSGSRVFKSTRRTSPTKGHLAKPEGPRRTSRNRRTSHKASLNPGSGRQGPSTRSLKPRQRRQPPFKPQTRSATVTLDDQLATSAQSAPPHNAPKAPLADRLIDLNNSFTALDVANTLLPAHRVPFKDYVSSTPCTHYLCSIGEPHQEGLYLHEGKLSEQPHNYFGAANPPPELWKAYERVEKSEARETDFLNLQYFLECHPPFWELCREELWR